MSVKSPNTGLQPVNFARGLAVGVAPGDVTVSSGMSSYQVKVLRRWNDGSVKHFRVNGKVNIAQANVYQAIAISTGTPSGGTALTEADLAAAIPAGTAGARLVWGATTIDLSTLVGSAAHRTLDAGPEFIEGHWRSAVGSTGMLAWFHARLYVGGRVSIRSILDNGYLDNGSGGLSGNTDQTGSITVHIGGTQVYTNASITLSNKNSWTWSGWVGGDPQVTILDATSAQLRDTKLVTNSTVAADSATLDALVQTYTVNGHGNIGGNSTNGGMEDTGYQKSIGLLNNWDAMYVATVDERALKSVFANAEMLRHYGIVWRDFTTKNVPRLSGTFATWTKSGPGGGGGDNPGAGLYNWEISHHSSGGYLAYLLTADYFHYETMLMNAVAGWLLSSSAGGSGPSRIYSSQERAFAWCCRSVGQACAIMRTEDIAANTLGDDFRSLLDNNYAYLLSQYTQNKDTAKEWAGSLYVYESYTNATGTTFDVSAWMEDFMVAANGMNWDIEPLPSSMQYNMRCVRDIQYQWIVGRFGKSGDIDQYPFHNAAVYRITLSNDINRVNNFQTWREIYEKTAAANSGNPDWPAQNNSASNTLTGGNIDTTGGMHSYWGNLMPGLAYACDHKAAGALRAWQRFSGATNFNSTIGAYSGQFPEWGVYPRTDNNKSALQLACESLDEGQCVDLTGHNLDGTMLQAGEGDQMIQWANSSCWDPTRRKMHFVGKRQGNTYVYHHLTYAEATNQFAVVDDPWGIGQTTGHGYDHNAMDPITGDFYHRRYGTTTVHRYAGTTSTWGTITAMTGSPEGAGALSCFPNVGVFYNDGAVGCKRFNGSAWSDISGIANTGSYHDVGEFNPVVRTMLMGGGNASGYYKMGSNLVISQIGTAPPFTLTSSAAEPNGIGLLVANPTSGEFIEWAHSSGAWRAYTVRTDSYAVLTQSTGSGVQNGTPALDNDTATPHSVIACPIPAYGCIMFIQYKGPGSTAAKVSLYKHKK